jgi:hypothetical protein
LKFAALRLVVEGKVRVISKLEVIQRQQFKFNSISGNLADLTQIDWDTPLLHNGQQGNIGAKPPGQRTETREVGQPNTPPRGWASSGTGLETPCT